MTDSQKLQDYELIFAAKIMDEAGVKPGAHADAVEAVALACRLIGLSDPIETTLQAVGGYAKELQHQLNRAYKRGYNDGYMVGADNGY